MAPVTIPVVETERLILRGPTDADIEPLASFIADPDFGRYIPRRAGQRPLRERAERTLTIYQRRWAEQPLSAMGWSVTRKADGVLVGLGGVELDPGEGGAEIDYRFGKPYWGQGYATETARAMARYAFEHTDWERLTAYVVPENAPSVRVIEHIGFVYEREFNYLEMAGDPELILDPPIVAGYALARERFAPGDAFYSVRE